ncbi:MAG: helix-turn-helix transcriptional regulator [Proteobacteria bacterium]|nr:helix-turn-helix transcriptional regulator [Pseudomonadota bacterium]
MQETKRMLSKEVGEKIKKRRRELKISQEKLAEILDVTYQQVQRYENGTNKLNVENIQVIADALSVPLSYFFEHYEVSSTMEEKSPSLSNNEKTLLKHFRKIKDSRSKNIVLQVARLIAK